MDVEVHIDSQEGTRFVGGLRRNPGSRGETVTFVYAEDWLRDPAAFAISPALPLTKGPFAPKPGQSIPPTIVDSAPDRWGQQLMRRDERRQAEREGRKPRALSALDCLLRVPDRSRIGALRFKFPGEDVFQTKPSNELMPILHVRRLLHAADRVIDDEATDEDLDDLMAPGSSLGGARPKASVVDEAGFLCLAKFPTLHDTRDVELWEDVALQLAEDAGIGVPRHRLMAVAGRNVLIVRRFDRHKEGRRIPFVSALALTGYRDGETGSYPEIADQLVEHGSDAGSDNEELYRRMVFNILISNVDDHLRNHGFLRSHRCGWRLSPVYDLNPVPADEKEHILSTNISLEDGTCDIDLAESVVEYFGLSLQRGREIIGHVAASVSRWRDVANKVGARKQEMDAMATAFEKAQRYIDGGDR